MGYKNEFQDVIPSRAEELAQFVRGMLQPLISKNSKTALDEYLQIVEGEIRKALSIHVRNRLNAAPYRLVWPEEYELEHAKHVDPADRVGKKIVFVDTPAIVAGYEDEHRRLAACHLDWDFEVSSQSYSVQAKSNIIQLNEVANGSPESVKQVHTTSGQNQRKAIEENRLEISSKPQSNQEGEGAPNSERPKTAMQTSGNKSMGLMSSTNAVPVGTGAEPPREDRSGSEASALGKRKRLNNNDEDTPSPKGPKTRARASAIEK